MTFLTIYKAEPVLHPNLYEEILGSVLIVAQESVVNPLSNGIHAKLYNVARDVVLAGP